MSYKDKKHSKPSILVYALKITFWLLTQKMRAMKLLKVTNLPSVNVDEDNINQFFLSRIPSTL